MACVLSLSCCAICSSALELGGAGGGCHGLGMYGLCWYGGQKLAGLWYGCWVEDIRYGLFYSLFEFNGSIGSKGSVIQNFEMTI